MERGRSFSGGWNQAERLREKRVATVKPVSKSFSEDDLMKVGGDERPTISPRVFSRLKVQDLAALKKDSLISKLKSNPGGVGFFSIALQNAMLYTQKYTLPHAHFFLLSKQSDFLKKSYCKQSCSSVDMKLKLCYFDVLSTSI